MEYGQEFEELRGCVAQLDKVNMDKIIQDLAIVRVNLDHVQCGEV